MTIAPLKIRTSPTFLGHLVQEIGSNLSVCIFLDRVSLTLVITDGVRQNTAMHYACLGGHVEAVHLLLEKKGDVTLKNTYDHSPLDLAIDNLHHDVVITMLRDKRFD